jgi:hypothetical protein
MERRPGFGALVVFVPASGTCSYVACREGTPDHTVRDQHCRYIDRCKDERKRHTHDGDKEDRELAQRVMASHDSAAAAAISATSAEPLRSFI